MDSLQPNVDEREIFTRGPVVVFKWRNEPGWPVDYASRNVLDVFGYTTDAFVSGEVAYSDLVDSEDLKRVGAEVQAACEAGASEFTHEPYRVRRADGQQIWLFDHTNLIRDEAGEITHFHGYVIDITAQVEAQEENRRLAQQLLQAQKLESLGILAGGLAHDFNNVLTGVMGHAALARFAHEDGRPEQALESMEQVEALSLQAADLCKQLLAYSGRGKFVVRPLDVSRVVREVASMLQVAISKKAELVLELPEGLTAILGDRAQLQQIVMNLLSNASDALGEASGTIQVRVSEREVGAAELAELTPGCGPLEPGRYLSLLVEDDGVGMSAETKERLFEPFYTTKFAGRGLGLAAVLGIIRSHQGGIFLRSREGEGTRFELVFPPCDAPALPDHEPEVSDRPLPKGGGTVLLVDDEAILRQVGGRLLGLLGYEVELAVDGMDALEKLRDHGERYRFVVLDQAMPRLSGRETLQELRQLLPELPVILCSGYNQEQAIDADQEGASLEFLQKPYRLEQLTRAIERATGGSK